MLGHLVFGRYAIAHELEMQANARNASAPHREVDWSALLRRAWAAMPARFRPA